MATKKRKLPEELTEDLLCPVCQNLFEDPVVLQCGDSFCKSCINKVWDSEKPPFCPDKDCRKTFSDRNYITNKSVSKMMEKVQKAHPRERTAGTKLCMEHVEALKLFCHEDRKLICHICRVLSKHANHTLLSPKEAVSMFREMMETELPSKIKHFNQFQSKQKQKMSTIQNEAKSLEQHIKSEFAKMHQFLHEKELQMMQQLKEELGKILGKMMEKIRKFEEMKNEVQSQISEIQAKMKQEDPLLCLTEILEECKWILKTKDEENASNTALVSDNLTLGVYKSPLQCRVWKEMLSVAGLCLSHLTLDPKTSHPNLILSDNLTSVRYSDVKKQLSDNPERYNSRLCVVASQGFISGRHYWEVEVGCKSDWNVGVTRQSSKRKGQFDMNPKCGYWAIVLRPGNGYWAQDLPHKNLNLSVQPKKVGVYLDYEGAQVSFYNADDMSHLYTFTNTFTETLYAFFSPCNSSGGNLEPLKVLHL
ncbi:zinc-binding protein A33-like [Protopterus annectens]|uniref:zinc-binding protein A33-like n=1 Tax=Protopterus annectens TaxID=7888 RepID=UPI001CFA00A8|nr:zinc-binding protein A33-like [Protopterus annectens]